LFWTVNISETGRIETVAGLWPGLPKLLENLKTGILQRAELIAEKEKQEVGNLSRKYNEGRHDAIQSIASIMHRYLDRPHYAAVAAIANVLFDTSANDEITPDAVRKAVARKKPDDSLE
jgi:adenylate kinase